MGNSVNNDQKWLKKNIISSNRLVANLNHLTSCYICEDLTHLPTKSLVQNCVFQTFQFSFIFLKVDVLFWNEMLQLQMCDHIIICMFCYLPSFSCVHMWILCISEQCKQGPVRAGPGSAEREGRRQKSCHASKERVRSVVVHSILYIVCHSKVCHKKYI